MCRQASWSLQASLDGETRFLRSWTESKDTCKVTMADVHAVYARLFEITAQEAKKLSVFCSGADDDLIQLSETTLPDALASGSHQMLRLHSSRWACQGRPSEAEERRCRRMDTSLCKPSSQDAEHRRMTDSEARECFRMDRGIAI